MDTIHTENMASNGDDLRQLEMSLLDKDPSITIPHVREVM